MKTYKINSVGTVKRLSHNQVVKLSRNILIAILFAFSFQSFAQSNSQVITITGTQFTYPLIKRWISEYSRINPELKFKLINEQENSGLTDIRIIAHTPEKGEIADNKTLLKVGRFAILPITNEKNNSFSKDFKKGVRQERLKAIFMKEENNFDTKDEKDKEPEYTVYTKTPQSALAKAISSYLGNPAEDLKGIYVTGDDLNLITSLLDDSTGVSYNNLGLVYNLEKRVPINGIKILPIDLNNNGRLDKEEQIYGNLDQVITYLEESNNSSIPTDYVSFVTDKKSSNPLVENFLNWVKEYGQEYNHQYGFLDYPSVRNTSLTKK
jgi:phosphate transport system substrate-binding protein